MSHPVWVRGLKRHICHMAQLSSSVAPRVGAWIETIYAKAVELKEQVAPRVGAWIET